MEKAFSKHSATLSAEIEKAATEAKEGAKEALTKPLQNYVANVCSDTYQNPPEGSIPEWVIIAKGQINENLTTKVKTWWAEMIINSSSGKKPPTRTTPETVSFETRSLIRSIFNKLNGTVFRLLTV